jgi:hypothetical protein
LTHEDPFAAFDVNESWLTFFTQHWASCLEIFALEQYLIRSNTVQQTDGKPRVSGSIPYSNMQSLLLPVTTDLSCSYVGSLWLVGDDRLFCFIVH